MTELWNLFGSLARSNDIRRTDSSNLTEIEDQVLNRIKQPRKRIMMIQHENDETERCHGGIVIGIAFSFWSLEDDGIL